MREIPIDSIKKKLISFIPFELLHYLPDKWEKIGAIATIRLPHELKEYKQIIGKAYAEILHCSTILNDVGGIAGIYRNPMVEVIFGSSNTVTIHSENGIRFKLDPQKIMFSSGNITERRRMATIAHINETVVDLFAGIGYFTIPMAFYSRPQTIVACEINPVAFNYLQANVVLNHVNSIVKPIIGDNRMIAPKDCADRVIMGYLKDPQNFLQIAIECLRNNKGIIHYHELVPVESIPELPMSHIKKVAKQFNRSVKLLKLNIIKSYAPRINHVVLDVRILE